MASVSRKSIVLSKDCAKGTILKADDLTLRRPGTGISSHHLNSFVGSFLRHNLTAGSLLKWSDIKERE